MPHASKIAEIVFTGYANTLLQLVPEVTEDAFLYQLIPERGLLRVLDSGKERFSMPALANGLPRGHYKLEAFERIFPPAPRPPGAAPLPPGPSRTDLFGTGRIPIADVTRREAQDLLFHERAEETLDGLRIGGIVAPIGNAAALFSPVICGAGTLNRQALHPAPCGIRIHNVELVKLMAFIDLRLRIKQLVLLTVV